MASVPKPYVKGKYYCTSLGGIPHQKLCRITDGLQQANKALARLVAAHEDVKEGNLPALVRPATKGWTVSDAIHHFIEVKRVDNRKGTADWYTDKLKALDDRFGTRQLSSLTLQDGLHYKTWLRTEKEWFRGLERKRGVGSGTVNAYFRAAKALFLWCSKPSRTASTGLRQNPWSEIKYGEEKGRERLITEQELNALLSNCTDGSVADGSLDLQEQILTLRFTTMRPGELRALRWEHVQLDQHRIVFPPNLIKTKRRREVVLLDRVKDILTARKARLVGHGALCKGGDVIFAKPTKDRNGVMRAGLGQVAITADSFSQRFRRVFLRCVALGLIEKEKSGERLVPYSSRHARCTTMLSQGIDVVTVMMDMGHASVKTTQKYLHLSASQIANSIREKDAG